MENAEVARLLRQTAALLEFKGEKAFRLQSYQNAAETVKRQPRPVVAMDEEALRQLPGIGDNLIRKIREIAEDGSFAELERLRAEIPPGIETLLGLSGLGPKKLKTLYEQLGISTPEALLEACRDGRVGALKGFGKKSVEQIMRSLEFHLANRRKRLYAEAEALVLSVESLLHSLDTVRRFQVAGAYRRLCPVVDELVWVVAADAAAAVEEALAQSELLHSAGEPSVWHHRDESELPLRFRIVSEADFAQALVEETGSPEFLAQASGPLQPEAEEEIILNRAGLPNVLPLHREAEWLATAPEKLRALEAHMVAPEDVHGCIHAHSTYSDGINTLEEMARACLAQGWEYLVISDHSKAAFYANGLNEASVEAQWAEIDRLNEVLAPFRIFKGIEADILSDGSLDYSDDFRAQFEFVIASVHSPLEMDTARATARLVRAIEHPQCTLLGHPTGRLLLRRPGYAPEMEKVIDACAANGVAIEINANPLRLDLDWRWTHYAQEQGVWIAVNPDAHAVDHLSLMRYGLLSAQKGGLQKDAFMNRLGRDALRAHLRQRNQCV